MTRAKTSNIAGTHWKPEEVALLKKCKNLSTAQIAHLFPGRTLHAVHLKRRELGQNAPKNEWQVKYLRRPLTDATAYHVRVDYAAKRKRGYTKEEALTWLEFAYGRDRDVLVDILTNPKHYEAARRYLQNIREEQDEDGTGNTGY